MTNSQLSTDVAIIGGGPAGAVASMVLESQGHDCVMLERAKFPRYTIGESLVPYSYGTLSRVGLLPKLRASQFVPKHSVRFVSANGEDSAPFYFSETIDGDAAQTWQVERGAFDAMCLDHAAEAGVEVRTGCEVLEVLFDGSQATGVRIRSRGESYDLKARVVLDTSGRATILGNQLGLREPIDSLSKVSCWSYYAGGERQVGRDAGETTILLLPHGSWAWYIPLPDDIVSVGIVGDREHVLPEGSVESAYLGAIARHPGLCARLSGAERVGPVRGGARDLAYRNRQTTGDGWVMVGDARAFLDPIYSSGIFLALESAEQAALSVHRALESGDLAAASLGAFEPRLTEGVGVIGTLIHAFYDPGFSFGAFLRRYPDQRRALIDCLVGDVFKDMSSFTRSVARMTERSGRPSRKPTTQGAGTRQTNTGEDKTK